MLEGCEKEFSGNKPLGAHASSSRLHGNCFSGKGTDFIILKDKILMTGAGIFFKERYMSMK